MCRNHILDYGWLYDMSNFLGTNIVKKSERYLHTLNIKCIEKLTSVDENRSDVESKRIQ